MLPIEERYSARWFGLEDVFIELDNQMDNSIEIDEFFDLSSWEKIETIYHQSLRKTPSVLRKE